MFSGEREHQSDEQASQDGMLSLGLVFHSYFTNSGDEVSRLSEDDLGTAQVSGAGEVKFTSIRLRIF
jgi:hypothetical protein